MSHTDWAVNGLKAAFSPRTGSSPSNKMVPGQFECKCGDRKILTFWICFFLFLFFLPHFHVSEKMWPDFFFSPGLWSETHLGSCGMV